MRRVLVIDDDVSLNAVIRKVIETAGSEPVAVDSAVLLKDGLRLASENSYDLLFLDIKMTDGNSLDHLPFLKGLPDSPEIVIITGGVESDGALIAMKWGIWDYLEKPFRIEELILTMRRAFDYRNEKFDGMSKDTLKRSSIIGQSPVLNETLRQLHLAARSEGAVLLTGETGTGKELFAQAIHKNSLRSRGPYTIVDCATLPENLAESLLFGHTKGSFTGADHTKKGLIESAHMGTLFLDEIGELSLSLQKTLLRVIQEKKFRPIGHKEEVESNFRLVAATNRDLNDLIKLGLFREDLFFRLKSSHIEIPPLRERKEDIRELAQHFIEKIAQRDSSQPVTLTFEFLEYLRYYNWPGNVRELSQLMEQVVSAAGPGRKLFPIFLPSEIRFHTARILAEKRKQNQEEETKSTLPDSGDPLPFPNYKDFRYQTMKEAEYQYFRDLLEATERNISEACRISGLSRARLYQQLNRAGITGKESE